jgi:VWFA-related protein
MTEIADRSAVSQFIMKKSLSLIILSLGLSIQAFSQQPAPTPPADDAVVKISTDLIQVDVTVTDKNGKVVPGLSASDFELFENGDRQNITNFSFVSKIAGGAVAGESANNSQQEGALPPTRLERGSVRRTIAIVVDDLNLSFASVYYTRKALRRFVDEQMLPNDLVAIVRTGGGVGALQQFTSDKRILHAAIERLRWNPLGASGVDSLTPVGQNAQDVSERFNNESDIVAARGTTSSDPVRRSILLRENVSDKKRTDYEVTRNSSEQETGVYATTMLGTVKYLISGMTKLPGRKAMMFFSDGLAIDTESTKSRSSGVYGFLQDVVEAANRSSVTVYTFDTKGMKSMSIQASDSTYEIIDGHRGQKERERTADFKNSQDGLVYFANQTGGKALLNSDDLNGGIERALDEQAGYYLLAYQPDGDTFDPSKRKFNKLEVKLNRPGLKVSYRSGFFNNSTDTAAPQVNPDRQIAEALVSPFTESDIALQMNALYADDAADGPYIRSFLHIDAKTLKFHEVADGWKEAGFDVAAVTFGDNGMPVEHIETKYTIKSKGATYATMLDKGFVYVLIMPIKMPGIYQYRVALRDADSGKIGSASQVIEVPNLAKAKLTLSSLAVENVSQATWQNISQGKVGSGPNQIHVPSTLLYDSVLKQFRPGTILRYGFEAYNAKASGEMPKLETQAKIWQNNIAIVQGNVNKLDASTQKDPKHVRVSGAMLLKDTLEPGDYVLQMLVTDTATKQTASQLFPFEIVK